MRASRPRRARLVPAVVLALFTGAGLTGAGLTGVGLGAIPAFAATTTTTTTTVPPVKPSFTVAPDTALHDLQTVTVSGQHYTPNLIVSLSQCKLLNGLSGGVCYGATRLDVKTDASGSFSTPMYVRRDINETTAIIDCATAPATCGIIASQANQPTLVQPLSFDPAVPPAGPTITVQPSTDLHDGETVQVHGAGFTPNAKTDIAQCPAATFALSECDTSTLISVQSDATGAFDTSFVVHATITTAGVNSQQIDCTTTECKITGANDLGASEHADAIIAFASPTPPSALPRTGAETQTLWPAGAALLLLGAGLAATGRRRRAARRL